MVDMLEIISLSYIEILVLSNIFHSESLYNLTIHAETVRIYHKMPFIVGQKFSFLT